MSQISFSSLRLVQGDYFDCHAIINLKVLLSNIKTVIKYTRLRFNL